MFKTDRGLLEQIIHSILHNSVQHTPAHTKIGINVENKSDQCHISIQDNGPGIPATEAENVFQKFYRLSNSKTGGTGLGLSIAKGFTEALGGTIKLDKKFEKGVNFIIQIPAQTSAITDMEHEQG